ncbi:MAG: insulinase family protein, partial [Gammaproteobacteria bacterium]|nr:insulinase family protein [Gammaproteobacteria bacterium]
DNTVISLRASWIKGLQRVGGFGGKSDILAKGEVYQGDPGAYKNLISMITNASAKDLKATAKKWLSNGDYVLTVIPNAQRSFNTESTVDRSQLPFPTEFPTLDLPDIQRAKLSNGLEIVLAERHDVPMINLSVQFKSGHSSDSNEQPGLASFSMSMLTEGTKRYNALQLSSKLEELGTDLYTNVGLDSSSINVSSLKSNLIPSLDLLYEVMTEAVFDEKEIERKKIRWLASIDQSLSTPNGIVSNIAPGLLYGGKNPYGKPFSGNGTRESIQWMERESMIGYTQEMLNPSNATILVVGDTNLDEITTVLENKFGTWSDSQSYQDNVIDYQNYQTPTERKIYLVDKPGAVQSLIVAGQLLPSPDTEDEIDIELMNAVIGGSFTSRLNMNLREDKSWSYGARARLSRFKGPRPMLVYAPVQTDKTVPSIQEIIREYDEYLTSRPAQTDELEAIVKDRSLGLIGQFETFGALMGGLSGVVTFNRSDDYLESLPEAYQAIKIDDIHQATNTYIDPNIWTWIIVGDLSIIENEIRELELGKIEIIKLD